MSKYRKKPIIVGALQLKWDTWSEMCDFAKVGLLKDGNPEGVMLDGMRIGLNIPTSEGVAQAEEGDWIILDVSGGLYPCKADVFAETYEEVTK
jgi:hypothetical protein|tara:strand:+ start:82 stop:360 length:279 start_codon:yes stop_codon:yes gene_type:complete